jgi:hypothetical protein
VIEAVWVPAAYALCSTDFTTYSRKAIASGPSRESREDAATAVAGADALQLAKAGGKIPCADAGRGAKARKEIKMIAAKGLRITLFGIAHLN